MKTSKLRTKAFLKALLALIDRYVWVVGAFAILDRAEEASGQWWWIPSSAIFLGAGIWFFWEFFIQPFRTGLRGQ